MNNVLLSIDIRTLLVFEIKEKESSEKKLKTTENNFSFITLFTILT